MKPQSMVEIALLYSKVWVKKMRLKYQLISLELDIVHGSTLPLWKEENKTFLYI